MHITNAHSDSSRSIVLNPFKFDKPQFISESSFTHAFLFKLLTEGIRVYIYKAYRQKILIYRPRHKPSCTAANKAFLSSCARLVYYILKAMF